MSEKTILGGAEMCANSHVLCAESHTQHGVNVKKRLPFWEAFDENYLLKSVPMSFLLQPFLDAFRRTRITRSHHRAIVHDHSFPVDDEIVGIRVYIELVVHLVYILIVW